MTVSEALAQALTMLEAISRGQTYPAAEYHREVRLMRNTLMAQAPAVFKKWLTAMGYDD